MQAFGKIPFGVREIGVDLYSVSAHKIYAPKGTGALYVRKGVPLVSTVVGGRHEGGRRAGTENVVGAIHRLWLSEIKDAAGKPIFALSN